MSDLPNEITEAQKGGPFEIGLVLAGAVSGGAYQGGVIDFLVEALDAWHAAMEADDKQPNAEPKVPHHKVLVKVASGASAGSLTAAILAVQGAYRFQHVRLSEYPARRLTTGNWLYDGWVEGVGINDLLDTSDLSGHGPKLKSILNCRAIDDAVAGAIAATGSGPMKRAWLADPFALRLTVGNLRGVPYQFEMKGQPKTNGAQVGHAMMVHADWVDFAVAMGDGPGVRPLPPSFRLLSRAPGHGANWAALGLATKASSAFPFVLRPRVVERSFTDYESRRFIDPGDGTAGSPAVLPPIAPNWGQTPVGSYTAACMDGGIFNNEPMELARDLLSGGPLERNPRGGQEAFRAVLMVDPFIDDIDSGPGDIESLFDLLSPLLSAWKAQARFKPIDLALANNESIYSRFLIAPSRDYEPNDAAHPLASGGLGAFLGFLARDFRLHDYQLGRRNCQQFLKRYFTLPAKNPLFANWSREIRNAWLTRPDYADPHEPSLPIIPLVGDLWDKEEPALKWPKRSAVDLGRLRTDITNRLDAVFDAIKDDAKLGVAARVIANLIWQAKKGDLVDDAIKRVERALKDQQFK